MHVVPNPKRNRKTLLRVLKTFAKTYLPRVRVCFTNGLVEKASGLSDLKREIIYLSPKQELNADAIGLGLSYAYRIGPKYKKLRLQGYEMYFLTLLHEIGHFKIKERIPKSYIRLKREILGNNVSRDRLIELSYIESKIKRTAGEKESVWKLRLADFMSWLATDETISHHMKVENWAIHEFERKRKAIVELVLKAGLFPRQLGTTTIHPNSLTKKAVLKGRKTPS